ncbi:glycosyltransferase family 4 protein [Kineococcus radiotolerans]|uniref:Glycosyl transferase group 1 n=1 Tax=Kineococcus radiotolerans (strain ATCC BAA-149 / DSM 14245 / SRS30216) TaxID=266940 RepID=A6WCI7_KINRD|nr:glycosyltransferase family 4 protein [Kineococcus radiotolerans]ABS04526.1 glycosyl transferase group 1 [Kineococcus radiotolerans SRS30216 = ATCC BAA-149]
MRIGIVCPYSFDVPGGVQFHVRDLAEHLIGLGHHVRVLAPADDESTLPPFADPGGNVVAVPYNGSVARLSFGPVTAARVRRWIAEGDFDVLHVHEPLSPSTSLLALWAGSGPLVATFHTANLRSRAMQAAFPLLRPSLEKISARIAVSEDARRTVVEHVGGDAVVIPNGVFTAAFARAPRRPEWTGTAERPVVAFVGRLDEPRKGLPLLCRIVPLVRAAVPGARFLVAGRGDVEAARALLDAGGDRDAVEFLGAVDDPAKESLLASADVYLAPHTGGESFGIVLVEAMAAGVPVVAADLGAFRRVLGDGEFGRLFPVGDARAAADTVLDLLARPDRGRALGAAGRRAAARYDWSVVAAQVLAVYETVRARA